MKYCLVLIIVFGTIAAEAQTITGKAVFRDGQLLERTLEINSVMTMTLQGQTREEPNGMTLVTMLSSKGLSDSTIEIHTTTKKFKHTEMKGIYEAHGLKIPANAKTTVNYTIKPGQP
jgi:hypothetical protein